MIQTVLLQMVFTLGCHKSANPLWLTGTSQVNRTIQNKTFSVATKQLI
jgi:hypothetical protein